MDPYIHVVNNELVLPGMNGKRIFLHISDNAIKINHITM